MGKEVFLNSICVIKAEPSDWMGKRIKVLKQ